MRVRLPPLNALRAFEAAARHASFVKAARELNVTPGAVSRQIKGLEDTLGVALFHRRTRAVELTEIAQACLPKLREGFDCLSDAVAQLQARPQREVLTLSVAPTFASKWLMPRLPRFAAVWPAIELRLSASRGLIDVLRHDAAGPQGEDAGAPDDADLSIRFGSGNYPGLEAIRLFDVSITPMCSPRLLDGEHALRSPADLRHHTLLHDDTVYFQTDQPNWVVWLDAAGVEGVDGTRGPRFSHTALALDAAAQGLGIALGLPLLAATDLAAGRLVQPFSLRLPSRSAYYLVWAPANAGRPAIAAFRDWLLDEVASSE